MLQRATVLYHPRRRQALVEAEWLAIELKRRGVATTVGSGWDESAVDVLCRGSDLVLGLGGDGTIIHVSRLAAPLGVPVVGINLGRVGFLAELTPDGMHDKIDQVASGSFWIEERTMLEAVWRRDHQEQRFLALNEVAVARGPAPRAIHVHILLDGEEFVTYTADGVLVATATGSTAYSLAAGGPILYPESRDFVITPVAPHLHIGRSTVVSGATTVTLGTTGERPAIMSVDGVDERPLKPEDLVTVCRSATVARFARLGPRTYFYSAVSDRLK